MPQDSRPGGLQPGLTGQPSSFRAPGAKPGARFLRTLHLDTVYIIMCMQGAPYAAIGNRVESLPGSFSHSLSIRLSFLQDADIGPRALRRAEDFMGTDLRGYCLPLPRPGCGSGLFPGRRPRGAPESRPPTRAGQRSSCVPCSSGARGNRVGDSGGKGVAERMDKAEWPRRSGIKKLF